MKIKLEEEMGFSGTNNKKSYKYKDDSKNIEFDVEFKNGTCILYIDGKTSNSGLTLWEYMFNKHFCSNLNTSATKFDYDGIELMTLYIKIVLNDSNEYHKRIIFFNDEFNSVSLSNKNENDIEKMIEIIHSHIKNFEEQIANNRKITFKCELPNKITTVNKYDVKRYQNEIKVLTKQVNEQRYDLEHKIKQIKDFEETLKNKEIELITVKKLLLTNIDDKGNLVEFVEDIKV